MTASGLVMGVCVAVVIPTSGSKADVWEFDRQGNVLNSPREELAYNFPYVANVTADPQRAAAVRSSRSAPASAHSAIYRPMAEGVAAVYAQDPAVAEAGLSQAEFVRVFVALIDQESRFNPAALSPKGARGLGQLMPQTAAQLGVDAAEPMANLQGAARYLTAQLAAFDRVDYALAAYNAGPHRIAQYGGVPPFRETRDYVARITAAADIADGPASSGIAPVSETGRAASAALEPELVASDGPASPPIDQPVQGTVLEWKR